MMFINKSKIESVIIELSSDCDGDFEIAFSSEDDCVIIKLSTSTFFKNAFKFCSEYEQLISSESWELLSDYLAEFPAKFVHKFNQYLDFSNESFAESCSLKQINEYRKYIKDEHICYFAKVTKNEFNKFALISQPDYLCETHSNFLTEELVNERFRLIESDSEFKDYSFHLRGHKVDDDIAYRLLKVNNPNSKIECRFSDQFIIDNYLKFKPEYYMENNLPEHIYQYYFSYRFSWHNISNKFIDWLASYSITNLEIIAQSYCGSNEQYLIDTITNFKKLNKL